MLWRHGAEAYILTHPWLPALICMILLISDFWLRLVQQKYYRKQSTWEYVGGVDEFVFGPKPENFGCGKTSRKRTQPQWNQSNQPPEAAAYCLLVFGP